jgi:MFS family permease
MTTAGKLTVVDGYKYKLISLSAGHTVVNMLDVMGPVLIVFLALSLNLSNTQIGLAAGMFLLVASLTQPVAGRLLDQGRVNARWCVLIGLAWQATWFVVAMLASRWFAWFLAAYVVSACGLGLYYVAGMVAASTGGRSAVTVYLAFGYIGLSVGPVLAGALLSGFGASGLIYLAAPLGVLACAGLALHQRNGVELSRPEDVGGGSSSEHRIRHLIPLFAVQALRMWSDYGAMIFTIRLVQQRGWTPVEYGGLTTAWTAAEAVFVLLGNRLVARLGRSTALTISLISGAVALFMLPCTNGLGTVVAALWAGASLSIAAGDVATIQELWPARATTSTVTGFIMAIITTSGGVATSINGWIADQSSPTVTIWLMAVVALAATVCVRMTPDRRTAMVAETSGIECL